MFSNNETTSKKILSLCKEYSIPDEDIKTSYIETGKEYYFVTGSHAAIIRKVETGYEYLELQSYSSNGWKPLDKTVLKNRFKAKHSRSAMGYKYESDSFLIDIEKLQKDGGFKKMLGYINTDATKQMKGKYGRPK